VLEQLPVADLGGGRGAADAAELGWLVDPVGRGAVLPEAALAVLVGPDGGVGDPTQDGGEVGRAGPVQGFAGVVVEAPGP
jgi:hypothetical protein